MSRMVSYKDYVAGWLDSSIHDFLEVLPAKAASIRYALITCVDSNPNPASLRERSPELKAVAPRAQVVGTGLLVPTELLLEADSANQIFFGFDELWFFPNKSVEPKPSSASLVGPARLDQSRLNKAGRWMSRNSCALALGGGEGLNFIVRARGLVGYVLGQSIEQPQPQLETVNVH